MSNRKFTDKDNDDNIWNFRTLQQWEQEAEEAERTRINSRKTGYDDEEDFKPAKNFQLPIQGGKRNFGGNSKANRIEFMPHRTSHTLSGAKRKKGSEENNDTGSKKSANSKIKPDVGTLLKPQLPQRLPKEEESSICISQQTLSPDKNEPDPPDRSLKCMNYGSHGLLFYQEGDELIANRRIFVQPLRGKDKQLNGHILINFTNTSVSCVNASNVRKFESSGDLDDDETSSGCGVGYFLRNGSMDYNNKEAYFVDIYMTTNAVAVYVKMGLRGMLDAVCVHCPYEDYFLCLPFAKQVVDILGQNPNLAKIVPTADFVQTKQPFSKFTVASIPNYGFWKRPSDSNEQITVNSTSFICMENPEYQEQKCRQFLHKPWGENGIVFYEEGDSFDEIHKLYFTPLRGEDKKYNGHHLIAFTTYESVYRGALDRKYQSVGHGQGKTRGCGIRYFLKSGKMDYFADDSKPLNVYMTSNHGAVTFKMGLRAALDAVCIHSPCRKFLDIKPYFAPILDVLQKIPEIKDILPTLDQLNRKVPFSRFTIASIANYKLFTRGSKMTPGTPWNTQFDKLRDVVLDDCKISNQLIHMNDYEQRQVVEEIKENKRTERNLLDQENSAIIEWLNTNYIASEDDFVYAHDVHIHYQNSTGNQTTINRMAFGRKVGKTFKEMHLMSAKKGKTKYKGIKKVNVDEVESIAMLSHLDGKYVQRQDIRKRHVQVSSKITTNILTHDWILRNFAMEENQEVLKSDVYPLYIENFGHDTRLNLSCFNIELKTCFPNIVIVRHQYNGPGSAKRYYKNLKYVASQHCDGEYDCADGSDEKGCSPDSMNITSRCGKLEFECADKITCIHSSWVCDADVDCPDGADEKDCDRPKCRSDQFECRTNGDCIPGHLQCSGMPECNDGSDEEHCATSTPCDPLTHFSCQTSGLCVSLDKICDQRNDCGDWGDEPRDRCGVNECATENGGCAEICVDTPIGHYCECKAGFKLVGNSTCEDINECETPGTCSQLCVNEKGTFKCECVEGYLRDPKDHTRCKAVEGHASLLFALRRDIRKISLDHLKMTLIVEKTRSATALDYMFRTGMIFWTDTHEGKIYKAPIDEGSAKSVVVEEGLSNADGLAIDWVYNHIYWTDSGKKDIAVAELDGKMRRTLIKDGLVEPRAIAVNPVDGWMYWTDWGVTPGRIERAGMDGSRREIIVSTGLKWPNGLTLDLVQERVYWVDAKMNSISSVNYDGSDRRLVLQSHSALAHPFSITTFEDWVYWTDWANETIFKANKFTGKELSAIIPPNTVKHVMSVHVYHAYRQPDGENHCTPLNGRCSHLCLPAPKVNERSPLISCGCPDGLVLTNDGQNCAPDPAFNLHHLLHRMQDALPDDSMMKAELNRTLFPVIGGGKRISKPGSNRGQNNVQRGTESGMDQGDQYSHVSSSSEPDTNTIAGIVIGILSALLVLVILVVLVLYRHFFVKGSDTMNFDNPVYRKTTTEDRISIEKNRYNKSLNNGGGHGGFNNSTSSSITISDEAEEPLTRRESQPIAIQQSSSSQSRLGHRGQCQVQPMLSQQEEASEYV
ncbi:Low-density lipoprotein receptor 2 [Folsomia candida]|uniref:Low-density lipoprotein receptor 2 n=1 Tax=Folsomia candida TaxID=158441 RepID=A0A226E151_FOLCA|nr:Low-density lipoprotein receptor 2 [Folsomia candida]